MAPTNISATHSDNTVRPKISWGAVIAAVVVALALQALFGMLGTAIGASTIDPTKTDGSPSGTSFGIGAGIWWVITSLISLYCAGWISGHLSGAPRKSDAVLHGLAAWALVTMLMLYFISSTAGSVFNSATSVLGKIADVSAKGAASAAPALTDAAKNAASTVGFSFDDLKNQARTVLAQTGKPNLQPNAVEQAAKDAASPPRQAGQENQDIGSMLDRLFASGKSVASSADRDAVINVVMQRTGKSKAEAEQQVAAWEASYQQSKAKFEEAKQQAEVKARQAAEATAKAVSRAALLAFIASLLGALAAMYGASRSATRYFTDFSPRVEA